MMQEIVDAVKRTGAKRLMIDSLAGFEMALAPAFRADFRESLYRLIFALTATGISILSTSEMPKTFTELSFSSYSISFLTDDIIRIRYIGLGIVMLCSHVAAIFMLDGIGRRPLLLVGIAGQVVGLAALGAAFQSKQLSSSIGYIAIGSSIIR
jgi:hypothetical protein